MKLYRFVEYDIPDTDERGEKLVSVDEPLYRKELEVREEHEHSCASYGCHRYVRVNGADDG